MQNRALAPQFSRQVRERRKWHPLYESFVIYKKKTKGGIRVQQPEYFVQSQSMITARFFKPQSTFIGREGKRGLHVICKHNKPFPLRDLARMQKLLTDLSFYNQLMIGW